jgi:hypothetical protein
MKTLSMNYGAFGATLALVINALFALQVHAANPAWVYYPSENIISNDDAVGQSKGYVLNVKVLDANAHTLQLGNGSRGDAFKTFGGETLDLSERIEDTDGTQWTITKFGYDALRATANSDGQVLESENAPFKSITFPRELTSAPGQHLNNRGNFKLTSVVLDCPEWAGSVDGWFLPYGSIELDASVTVNLPKITSIGSSSLCAGGDVSKWNLTSVETVADDAFNWGKLTGTLKLPNAKNIGWLARCMHFDSVWLGTASCSLEEVANSTFGDPDSSRYTKEFVLGGAKGWKVGNQAFTSCKLERVYMIGAVPTFADSDIAFGATNATDAAARTIAFYIPKNDPEWASIAASATKLTDAEIDAFKAAHPTWIVPFGVVATNVFQTANEQYLGYIEKRGDYGYTKSVKIENRAAGQYAGDTVTFRVDGKDWTGTSTDFPVDHEITVTATTTDTNAKISWEGTLPDGTTPTDASFTLTLTNDVALNVRFTHPWEYDADAKTISDGYWTLAVKEKNTSGRELQLGAEAADRTDGRTSHPWAFTNNFTATSPAELDLTGAIYTKGGVGDASETWTITAFCNNAFKAAGDALSSFYAPTTLKDFGKQVFNNGLGSMKNFVVQCPELTGTMGGWSYELNNAPIERLILAAPKLTNVTANNFGSMTLSDTDLATWDLTGLTAVGDSGMKAAGPGPDGELVLPNIETIGAYAFMNWTRLPSASLGTNGTLKTVGAYLFGSNTGLKKLDFGESYDFTADENAFMSTDSTPLALEEIYFTSKTAPSVTTLDALVKGRTLNADGTKPVVIYAPVQKNSWQALKSTMTSAEQAEAAALRKKGVRTVGVYVAQDGRRIAWLALHPSLEFHGFMLFLR